ncbi:MAG: 4Fe-4S binding protein [Planctomycetaceae bacterium]|nr:4Fe-4S binding protein [Planctomycetaceae bacterium]
MRKLRSALILGLGFFALAAQTLLFRDFLTSFEGSELGVGSFFGSWLLWVGLGAVVGRIVSHRVAGLTKRFELTVLLYLPAFLVQQYLIAHARDLGGISAYEVYPFARMFAIGMVANGPISLTTGLLFTLACRWWEQEQELPPARVYMVEALGGFLGGVVVTLLLVAQVTAEAVICCAAVVLVAGAAAGWLALDRSARSVGSGIVLWGLLIGLSTVGLSGLATEWSRWNDQARWSRLLPPDEFRGSFTTAQAKYLYGERGGQFVVMSWGGVSETLPNTEQASEVIALTLAQHPTARNVLVVGGDSLGIGLRLRELPQIRDVAWLHPDPAYPRAVLGVLPAAAKAAAQELHVPGEEVRAYLETQPRRFDLVLLNLSDPTTLVLNRYWSREFFRLVRESLTEGGVVCTRLTGAANYMGDERVYLGCSALATLKSVFRNVVLKPGDESWLMASDGASLSTAPAELRDRFAGIDGAAEIYPAEGLMSLYAPDRIQFQMEKYSQAAASVDSALLVNRDQRPKSLVFSLLLALRRTTPLSFARHVPVLWAGGIWLVACPIVIYGLLRVLYMLAPRGGRATAESVTAAAAFDGRVLVFATGLAGMSLSIVLMFQYQSQFGSLFLDIGLISALFMFGSFAGSLLGERLVRRPGRLLLPVCLVLNLGLLALVSLLPQDSLRAVYGGLFVAAGVFVGVYFPVGAERLQAAGKQAAAAGASLEMLDHWGGAAGALVSGWLLLPLLGTRLTLGVLALAVGVNLVPAVLRARPGYLPAKADWFDRLVRPAGYALLGLAASVLAVSHVVAALESEQAGRRVYEAALVMTGSDKLVAETATQEDGSTLPYWRVPESEESGGGFVFGTSSLAGGVSGYGGPVVMAVYVRPDGTLRDLRIVESRETPAYVESLHGWLRGLPGRNVFRPADLDGVDAVTGATITSEAVLRTLQQAGPQFALAALEIEAESTTPALEHRVDPQFVCLAVLLVAGIVLRYVPGVWLRRGMLLVTLVLTGFVWNLQYGSQQVMGILSWSLPGNRLGGSFLLVLVVPIVVLLAGNVYCGYVCPFGALQELVGDLRPGTLGTDPEKRTWRYGRAVKYVLLALVVVLFGLTRDYGVLSPDPLLTVFSPLRDLWTLGFASGLVVLSFFYRRFWCRNLCPAGAFLALLGGARLLRRRLPPAAPGRCDLGVRTVGELDCLFCDRCKHGQD